MSSPVGRAYDLLAPRLDEVLGDAVLDLPEERAALAAFHAAASSPVLDGGCGTGRGSRLMSSWGLATIGLDLSASSVARARASRAGWYAVSDLRALPLADASVGGALLWYAIGHMSTDELPRLFGELMRVCRVGAPVLVSFQAGRGHKQIVDAVLGVAVDLAHWRHPPEEVVKAAAGFSVVQAWARPAREVEKAPQHFVVLERVPVS